MWEKIKSLIQNSRFIQLVLVFVGGLALGAFLYPTKHIEERMKNHYEEIIASSKEEHKKELSTLTAASTQVKQEYHEYKQETEKKINTLTVQVHDLKSKTKTAYYKVVRPDGTIEIKRFTESDVQESTKVITQIQEEFTQKVASIESKWETIHKTRVQTIQKEFDAKEQKYQSTIKDLEKEKVVDINKRRFGMQVGYMSNSNYYFAADADIFGPFFVGAQSQMGIHPALGGGLGLRF